jgi:hypothetical protein
MKLILPILLFSMSSTAKENGFCRSKFGENAMTEIYMKEALNDQNDPVASDCNTFRNLSKEKEEIFKVNITGFKCYFTKVDPSKKCSIAGFQVDFMKGEAVCMSELYSAGLLTPIETKEFVARKILQYQKYGKKRYQDKILESHH